ncbi:MAG: hypothetical protein LBV80_11595 [Deltaproteobacteria bacterium]|jgi:hypothetical protein|nr:hypothetical protein [Deltaproteobacteria bacterium]
MNEQNEHGQAEMPTVEAEPVLADDGRGISLEEARALLAMKHNLLVGKDDPILMLVTLMNAYLTEIEKQHKRHEKAMVALLTHETGKMQQMLATTFQPGQKAIEAEASQSAKPSSSSDSSSKSGSKLVDILLYAGLGAFLASMIFWWVLK